MTNNVEIPCAADAVPGGVKQKNMAAEGRNRRALGDIGNLATVRGVEGKPLSQVSCPITRFFISSLSLSLVIVCVISVFLWCS